MRASLVDLSSWSCAWWALALEWSRSLAGSWWRRMLCWCHWLGLGMSLLVLAFAFWMGCSEIVGVGWQASSARAACCLFWAWMVLAVARICRARSQRTCALEVFVLFAFVDSAWWLQSPSGSGLCVLKKLCLVCEYLLDLVSASWDFSVESGLARAMRQNCAQRCSIQPFCYRSVPKHLFLRPSHIHSLYTARWIRQYA